MSSSPPTTRRSGRRSHVDITYDPPNVSKSNDDLFEKDSIKSQRVDSNAGISNVKSANIYRPNSNDNCAILLKRLEVGTELIGPYGVIGQTNHTVLEGHRVVCAKDGIKKGEYLMSFGLPFGIALEDIPISSYVINKAMLVELGMRHLSISLPLAPNFEDIPLVGRHHVDPSTYETRPSVLGADIGTDAFGGDTGYMGIRRSDGRGVATRNHIIILGVSSKSASYTKGLERLCQSASHAMTPSGGFDGVVAVAHTEGGSGRRPNNIDLLIRTLSSFMTHPNVGACLLVDHPSAAIKASDLIAEVKSAPERYGVLESFPYAVMTLSNDFDKDLKKGVQIVRPWVNTLRQQQRERCSFATMSIALQCGGSDAFSGVTANPLIGCVGRRLVRFGGNAVLAETDELIGAESYITNGASSVTAAQRFIEIVERFKAYAHRYGHSAEGNPSGGNKFRGLYNISLKSAGAALKKTADTPLDQVIEYGFRLPSPGMNACGDGVNTPGEVGAGYCMMDSPGNDLESIAGQVATGCNVIFFTTGNGSVTNFPFVPTLKVVTTSARYEHMKNEIDIDAGQVLNGVTFDELEEQVFRLTVDTASGKKTKGELAGHHQVGLWREWPDPPSHKMEVAATTATTTGNETSSKSYLPVTELPSSFLSTLDFTTPSSSMSLAGKVALVIPTSLCSSEIARTIADRLSLDVIPQNDSILKNNQICVIALPHSEGCGQSSGDNDVDFFNTMINHAFHSSVVASVFLEHGCERLHNATFKNTVVKGGGSIERFGWSSVQGMGGLSKSFEDVRAQLEDMVARAAAAPPSHTMPSSLADLRLGICSVDPVSVLAIDALGALATSVTREGGTVICSGTVEGCGMFDCGSDGSVGYGERPFTSGLFSMRCPRLDAAEVVTGLAATGVHAIIAVVSKSTPIQGHPFVPVLQISTDCGTKDGDDVGDIDVDYDMDDTPNDTSNSSVLFGQNILRAVVATVSGRRMAKTLKSGNVYFQISRGITGISL